MGFDNEKGIALPTVLLIAAILTIVSSIAVYAAIAELRVGTQDRRATQAFALAEDGVARLMFDIRGGALTWADIRRAGCQDPPIRVTTGRLGSDETFDAELTVFDPDAADTEKLPAAPWTSANASEPPCVDSGGNPWPAVPDDTDPRYFSITSVGEKSGSTRTIQQVLLFRRRGLPIGVFAENASVSGSPAMEDLTLFATGDVLGRDKIAFRGDDHFFSQGDFWSSLSAAAVPAAAHSVGSLYLIGAGAPEHPPPLNCTANAAGDAGASQWDQSARGDTFSGMCAPWTSAPPTSLFLPNDLKRIAPTTNLPSPAYFTLKDSAQRNGLYCNIPAGGILLASCTSATDSWALGGTGFDTVTSNGTVTDDNYIAYFDFESAANASTNKIIWGIDVKPSGSICDPDPGSNQSVVIVVRNGSLTFAPNVQVNGAVFGPEGVVRDAAGVTINGSIVAKTLESTGTTIYQIDDCWAESVPAALLKIELGQFKELD